MVESQQHYDVNIALKYSILEDIVSIIIYKCNFQVRKTILFGQKCKLILFQMPSHNNLFSKSTLFYQTKKVISKRRKCFQTKSMLDFSTEHKFKLGGETLYDFCIKIQIKSSTQLLKKSK